VVKGITHVVLDTPAGLHGKRLKEILRRAHKVVVPLQPSVFDMPPERVARDLAQWQAICQWLDQ